jgi:hypothetical protein
MAIDQNALERSLVLRAVEFGLTRVRSLFLYERLMAALPEAQRASAGELYVLVHLVVFVVFFSAAPFSTPAWIFYLFMALGIYRLFDVYSYQLRLALVDAWQTTHPAIDSVRRRILLAAVNFAELIIIFAIIYRTIERAVGAAAFTPVLGGKSQAIALAVSAATNGSIPTSTPVAVASRAIMTVEVLLAVTLLLIVLSLALRAVLTIRGRAGE